MKRADTHKPPAEGLDVSAVVCTRNAESTLPTCLNALRAQAVGELIVVDGSSTDGTQGIARELADVLLIDAGTGLATARQCGLDAARLPYVLHVGPDNVMPPGTIACMLQALAESYFSGIGAATTIEDTSGYLGRALDRYKRARYYPGERTVIGTPYLFPTELQRSYGYDPRMGYADDSDLCTRMAADGHRVAIADCWVYEQGPTSLRTVWRRWIMYGGSDAQTWAKYAQGWSLGRKARSLTHPLRAELLQPLGRLGFVQGLAALPFLVLVAGIRYVGWVRAALGERGAR